VKSKELPLDKFNLFNTNYGRPTFYTLSSNVKSLVLNTTIIEGSFIMYGLYYREDNPDQNTFFNEVPSDLNYSWKKFPKSSDILHSLVIDFMPETPYWDHDLDDDE